MRKSPIGFLSASVFVLLLACVGSIVVWLPKIQVASLVDPLERSKEETAARDIYIKGIGGLAVFVTAFIAWSNLKNTEKSVSIAQDKQAAERFAKAVEMLGNEDSIHIRLGGIYALERIAANSSKDHWQVMELLAAFVRDKASLKSEGSLGNTIEPYPYLVESLEDRYYAAQANPYEDYYQHEEPEDFEIFYGRKNYRYTSLPCEEVQAAITAIGRRKQLTIDGKNHVINLSSTYIKDIFFTGNYDHVNFDRAHFQCVNFKESTFRGANFANSVFARLNVECSDLKEANFDHSAMGCSSFLETSFEKTTFRNARVAEVKVQKCNFRSADFENFELGCTVPTNLAPSVKESIWAQFGQSSFCQTSFHKITGNESHIRKANFVEVDLQRIVLEDSRIKSVKLERCSISESSFKRAKIEKTTVDKSDLSVTQFDEVQFGQKVDFGNTELLKVSFAMAWLNTINFTNVQGLTFTQVTSADAWRSAQLNEGIKEEILIHDILRNMAPIALLQLTSLYCVTKTIFLWSSDDIYLGDGL